jgi:hypothetical protein
VKNDTEFEDRVIRKVTSNGASWDITMVDGWSFTFGKDQAPGVIPEADDTARFYGKGLGYSVRGLLINGVKIFYKTVKEQEEEHKQWCSDKERDDKASFEKNKADLDTKYEALPAEFKLRLDSFRRINPDFRWKHEGYEMFVCTEAIKIAKALKTIKKIDQWQKLPVEKQDKIIDVGAHSGNTFGAAVFLAKLYLKFPELVREAHGALCPLVGCKDYGCHSSLQGENDGTIR